MSLAERDRKSIWHPFTQAKDASPPIPIVRGEGTLLFDDEGKSYIDAVSSWWVNLHGHSHRSIVERVNQQLKTLEHVIFAQFTHEPAVELAEKLLTILPSNQARVFYTDDGSTAVEAALKIAIQYWRNKGERRTKVIAFNHSYHGDTLGAVSVSSRSQFSRAFEDFLFEVIHIEPPLPGREDVSLAEMKAALKQNPAAFIYEPLVQGAGGMLMHDAESLNALLHECRESGGLLIADEVMTGFGRTGGLFASHAMAEKPDIMCLSKGITGGFVPLGAATVTEEVFDSFLSSDKAKTFYHGHSYTGNPIACAAALASYDLLVSAECGERRARIEEMHRKFLDELLTERGVARPRVTGTILAFDVDTGESAAYTHPVRDLLYKHFIERGVLLRPLGNIVYVLPPYCITEIELRSVYDSIRSAVALIQKAA